MGDRKYVGDSTGWTRYGWFGSSPRETWDKKFKGACEAPSTVPTSTTGASDLVDIAKDETKYVDGIFATECESAWISGNAADQIACALEELTVDRGGDRKNPLTIDQVTGSSWWFANRVASKKKRLRAMTAFKGAFRDN